MGGSGPVDTDQDLGFARSGDLGQGLAQHGAVVGGGVGSGVAGAQFHGQALHGVGAPCRQGVEPERFLEGGGGFFLVGGGGDDGGVHVHHDPTGERFSRYLEGGEPAGAQGEQVPHVAAGSGSGLVDLGQECLVDGG